MKIIIREPGVTDALSLIDIGIIICQNLKLPFEGVLFSESFFIRNKISKNFVFNYLNLGSIGAKSISIDEYNSLKVINASQLEKMVKFPGKYKQKIEGCIFNPRPGLKNNNVESLGNLLGYKYSYKYANKRKFCKLLGETIQNSPILRKTSEKKSTLFVHYRLGDIAAIPDIFTNNKDIFYFRSLDKIYKFSEAKNKPDKIQFFKRAIAPITYEKVLNSARMFFDEIIFCSDGFDSLANTATSKQLAGRTNIQFSKYLTNKFLGNIISKSNRAIIGENEEYLEKVLKYCISSTQWISGSSYFPFYIFENAGFRKPYLYKIDSNNRIHILEKLKYLRYTNS